MNSNKFSALECDDMNETKDNNEYININSGINRWKSVYTPKHFGFNQNKTTYINNKFAKKDQNKNLKKILCQNVIAFGDCDYGDKCLYAHKLSEQKMEDGRKCAYDILNGTDDLSHIDLKKDIFIYKSLQDLTRVCESCIANKCTGGYNCKFGACLEKYRICSKDLNYGNCVGDCAYIHLTKRGLKHYHQSSQKFSYNFYNDIYQEDLDGQTHILTEKIEPTYETHSWNDEKLNLDGTLLSTDFFKQLKYNEIDTDMQDIQEDKISILSDSSSESDAINECFVSIFS